MLYFTPRCGGRRCPLSSINSATSASIAANLSFAAKAAGSSLSGSLSNFSSSWSPNTDRLLPGMKLPRAFGSGKSSSISNTESTRQSVKFARFLMTVRTCRSLCRQSPVLVTASSHPLRPLSRKSPSQLNLLGIRSTCLPAPPETSAPPVIPSATRPHHRLWLVTALCVSVLVAISILTLGPHPLAARFLDRDTHAAHRLARRSPPRQSLRRS